MADEPFRLRFLKGLTGVLETITKANGYNHDLAGSVFRGRLTFGDNDPVPMLSIIEPPLMPNNQPHPVGGTESKVAWDIIVQGFADDDRKNPTDPAHMLLADTKQALAREMKKAQGFRTGANATMFGVDRARIHSFDTEIGFVRPSDDISSKAYFWLPLHLVVVESWLNPND